VEFAYFGANCLRITTKKAQVVVDDNLQNLGLKTITKPGDISLKTFKDVPDHEARFKIDMPGEYETAGIIVHGVASRAHMDEEGKSSATIYPELSEDQLEEIGMVDIIVVPVGNSGYTLDAVGALKMIKQIEPKVVIPTHFADNAIKYEVPQVDLSDALKNLGMEAGETLDKYKYKPAELTDAMKLVILNR
jgi:L-ascorbate metabolism protein UlaG (beta-lactamase superfamily)